MVQHNKRIFRLFKRGKIYHTYFSVVTNGQRIVVRESTGCTDENAATEYCTRRYNEIITAPAITHEITLDAAAAKWTLEVLQFQSSRQSRLVALRLLISEIGPNILLSSISKHTISAFVQNCRNRGRKPSTINRYLSLLSAICTRAREYWDCKTPNFKISQFKQSEPVENIKYFRNMDDVRRIIDCAAPHLQPIIWTAIYTGLRRGRILSLKWDHVDFDNAQIIFIGKNGLNQSVPIVPQLFTLLSKLPHVGEYVFTYRGHPITDIKKGWRNACKRAGIPYQSFHTLRHTVATWLLRDSHDLRLVKDVLGHKTIQTTLKYAHLTNDRKADGLNHLFAQNLHNNKNTQQ